MTVTVFSKPVSQCVNCRGVDIALRRAGIEYEKVMLNEDPKALDYVKSLGYMEAPVVVITDGDKVVDSWSGFSLDRINGLKVVV